MKSKLEKPQGRSKTKGDKRTRWNSRKWKLKWQMPRKEQTKRIQWPVHQIDVLFLPIKELGNNLNKEQFQNALRYNWSLPRLSTECVCGNRFDLAHALSCKKGGFITLRHNEICDLTPVVITEVCPDIRREPRMVELAEKKGETVQRAADFLRTKLSFSLPRSTLLCLRGSRSIKIEHNLNDLHLANSMSRVGSTDG